jgi:hypothetical protein
MPKNKVSETFLGELGLEAKVRQLLKKHGGSPSRVATVLAKDEEYKEAARAAGGRMKLMARDIHEFLTADAIDREISDHEEELEQVKKEVALRTESAVAQPTLPNTDRVWLRETTMQAKSIAHAWFPLAQRLLRILDEEMEDYEKLADELRESPRINHDTGERIMPQFPIGPVKAARESVETSLKVAQSILDDPVVKAITNIDQVVVKQGMDLSEFHKALFGTCKRLGITQAKALEAYSLYLADKSGTEVIDAVPLPPEPQWRKDARAESAARKAAEAAVEDPPIADGVVT